MVYHRLLIGHHGKYDLTKQKRDFRKGFFGIELCLLRNKQDIITIVSDAGKENFKYGVHFPLRTDQWRLRDAQYLSKDSHCEQESYAYLTKEIKYIAQYKPEYILLHYPKPMLVDPRVDWSLWRFADSTEYYIETEYSYQMFMEKSEKFFVWLSEQSTIYNFIPVLEFDLVNKFIYNNKDFYKLLINFPRIKICLDIARLHLQTESDKYFPVKDFIKQYAQHTYLVHLSNQNINKRLHHYPALPNLDIAEGWADVKKYLSIIKEDNNNFKLLFEHRSDLISDEQLNDCYQWIAEILSSN